MDGSIERRLTVAVSWAVARAASLDDQERYEDSYAITQEFRDWIMALESHPEELQASVLIVPNRLHPGTTPPPERDGLLEI